MLGLFVFSGSNELLHAYGNTELCSRILKNRGMSTMSDRLRSSTSSGVYSDGSSLERTPSSQAEINEHGRSMFSLEAEKFALADSFLPLISIYRASEEVLADAQQFIESPQFRIAFEPLVDSSFILTISDIEVKALTKQQEFTDAVSRLINFHHGPLLGYTYSTVSSLQMAKHRFEMSITGMLNTLADPTNFGNESGITGRINELDISAPFLFSEIAEKSFPRLRLLSEQLSVSNFGNSCLLFLDGRLLCFMQTETDTCRKYPLRSIIELANFVSMTSLQTDMRIEGRSHPVVNFAQVWVDTVQGKRLLNNAFEIHLTNSAVILCVTRADYSNALNGLSSLLTKLNIGYVMHNCNERVATIDKHINYICTTLREIAADKRAGRDSFDTTFLRNADTTNLWHGIRNEVMSTSGENMKLSYRYGWNISNTPMRGLSKRHLWPFTVKTRTTDYKIRRIQETNMEKRYYKLASMLTYFKHHLKSIMAEIYIKSSQNGKSFHLPRLEDAVQKFFLKYPIDHAALSIPDVYIYRSRLRDFLHPSLKRLDMLAYTCLKREQRFRLTFIPEEYAFMRELLEMESAVNGGVEKKMWSVTMHGSIYLLVTVLHLTTQATNSKESYSLFARSLLSTLMPERCSRLQKRKAEALQCTAVFDGFVNRELALRQTTILAATLQRTVYENLHHLNS
uniref:Uncharacterized protein n=1 Tax=Ascaris lumbricoides TaxID=6252 RepID=A0A9J2PBX2_ASCLU